MENIRQKLKIATWNKGNSLLTNSIDILQHVTNIIKPDILAVQELNIKYNDNIDTLTIPGYTLLHDRLIDKNGIARAGLLIKDNIKYKYRADLTNQEDAHIAITVHLTKQVKVNFHSWYRQWQEILPDGRIPGTKSIKAQKSKDLQKLPSHSRNL